MDCNMLGFAVMTLLFTTAVDSLDTVDIEQQVATLQSQQAELMAANQHLLNTIQTQDDQLNILNHKMKQMETRNQKYEEKLASLEMKYEYEMLMLEEGSSRLSMLHPNTTISFTAATTAQAVYPPQVTIPFDNVIANYGGVYNPNIGVFTCPVTGYYLFAASLYTTDSTGLLVEIHMGDESIVQMATGNAYSMASNSALILCEQFRQVSVRTVLTSDIFGSLNDHLSVFSGTLMFLE